MKLKSLFVVFAGFHDLLVIGKAFEIEIELNATFVLFVCLFIFFMKMSSIEE